MHSLTHTHTMTMKGKPINSMIIFICCFLFFLFFLITRSTFLISQKNYPLITSLSAANNQEARHTSTCNKIPPSLAHALVHYATSNITPQLSIKEISFPLNVLGKISPCNFLVFGLGHDSLMWASLNHGGRTVFLEENIYWIQNVTKTNPSLEVYHVVYNTKVSEADELHEMGMQQHCKVVSDPRLSKCRLALKSLPSVVYDTDWDLIMVDAPTGYNDGCPGRMSAIYTAGLMARNRDNGETHVFVHDVYRVVEDRFSRSFLCEGFMVEQFYALRHFIVPSHKGPSAGRPFCP